MAITHVFEAPPPGAAPDWTMPQNWHAFTDTQHRTWDLLFGRQSKGIVAYACSAFLAGLDILKLSKPGIPDLRELNARLKGITGWEVVAVPGLIPNGAFFRHLSQRRFPAANFLREPESLDYSEEPDMFHDFFGHVPLLANPVFADFLVAYGEAGLRAESLGAPDMLGQLYVHTMEFGLVAEPVGLRAYGAGLLSSYGEAVYAVTSPEPKRLRFDLPRVMRTKYLFDKFQRGYFVIDSFEHLLKVTAETRFADIYEKFQDTVPLEPGASLASDVAFAAQAGAPA